MVGLNKAALLLGAAMLVAPGAAWAEPKVSGDVAVYGGSLSVYNDSEGDDFNDGSIAGVNARLKFEMLQLDINAEHVSADLGYDYSTKGAALHVMTPGPEHVLGLMAAIGEDGDGDVTVGGAPYYTLAAEGAVRMGTSTFDAQVGYFVPKDNEVYIDSGFYAYVGSSTPLSDAVTLKLHARGSWMAESGTSDYSYIKAVSYGALLEYAASERLTLFGGMVGSYTAEPSEDENWSSASAVVGLRIPFGASEDKPIFADHSPLTGADQLRLNDWQ